MSSDPAPAPDDDSLDALSLARLPIRHPALRKARILKNGRLQSVIELYRDRSAGSGQYDLDNIAQTLGVTAADPDLLLLRYVALMPAFDGYSLRLLLRDLGLPEEKLADLLPSGEALASVTDQLAKFVRPMLQFGAKVSDPAVGIAAVRADFADLAHVGPIGRALMEKVALDAAGTQRFVEDYVDTFSAIAFYAYWAERLAPEVETLLATVKKIAGEPSARIDKLLRGALVEIVLILPDLMGSVRKRLASVEKVAVALWSGNAGVGLRAQQKQVREFQVLIAYLLTGVSAKVAAWRSAFPPNAPMNSAKRAAFYGSEMVHALQQLRDAALKGTRSTSFPQDLLRDQRRGDETFRTMLRNFTQDA